MTTSQVAPDSVIVAAIAAKLQAIAVDMGFTLKRTSRSLYVKDGEDFCTSIVGLDGLLVTAPDVVGSTILTLVDCAATIAAVDDLAPGDVIITNDAHTSGALSTHLADIHVIEPYFVNGTLVGYGWAFIHASDMGGRVPSSISPLNTEVFQEGLQIPPMKLVKAGVIDREIEAFIRANTRTPDANIADIRAMLAALRQGQTALTRLIESYGLDTYLQVQEEILRYSEARARAAMCSIPPGRYSFSDFLDDDGVSSLPVRFKVTLDISPKGDVRVDFTGTDPQVGSAFNIASKGKPNPMTTGRIRSILHTIDPDMPADGGGSRIVSVLSTDGSIVDARRPGAVGVRHGSAVRVSDAIGGAIFEAAPHLMPAAGSGVVIPVVVSEQRASGRVSQVLTRLFGGFGAAFERDGHDGKDNSFSNLASSPMESSESELQVHVVRYALRCDSGGPGQWRGGVGRELTFRVEASGTQVLSRGLERFVFRPWGVRGGRPGSQTEVILNVGLPNEERFRKIDVLQVKNGDTVTIRTPGGGGFGDPFDRDPAAVARDVNDELVSLRSARSDYGVVLRETARGYVVDSAETARARLGVRRSVREFDFGEERDAWESVFSSELYDALNEHLFALDFEKRSGVRADYFSRVLIELPEGFPTSPGTLEQRAAARSLAWEILPQSMHK